MVRGFVPPGFILTGAASDNWYNGGIHPDRRELGLPETAFYDVRLGHRQARLLVHDPIRAGTGMVSMGDADAVLVLARLRTTPRARNVLGNAPRRRRDAYDLDQVDSNGTM